MKYNMNIIEKDLDNGLHVILVHKPDYFKSLFMLAAPCGGYDVVQKRDNELVKHRTGCAHFLEHQMFRLHGKDVTDDFAQMSAQTNAFTSYDKTAYYFQTTADVKEPLALLLDFVENLDITKQSVDKEKGIILSEYHMYDQNPEQRLLNNTWRALYKNHPMNIDILGTPTDISDMEVRELTEFYTMNYDPSRLTLVGITGKDIQEILSYIENHQANVSSQLSCDVHRVIEEEPQEVVSTYVQDEMDISVPYVCVAYKFEASQSIEESLLVDLAVQVRLDSIFSPLNAEYQEWLDKRIISQIAFAECDFTVDHGYILFAAQTEKVDEYIELVDHVVSTMQEPIDSSIFKTIQVRMIASNIRGLDSFDGLAVDLINAHIDGYDYFEALDLIKKMTCEDVNSVISNLDFANCSIIKILPKGSKTSNLE